MGKSVNIEGSITAYFQDNSLYEKYVESEQEKNERIKQVIQQLLKIQTKDVEVFAKEL